LDVCVVRSHKLESRDTSRRVDKRVSDRQSAEGE
jgi:hypothetical protein